jgi:outer membrane receptor for ferrienterochelin and colicins
MLVLGAAVCAAVAGSPRVAGADEPEDAPAVDVGDLPPLPPADAELSRTTAVFAATSAEEDIVVGAAKREQSLGNVASAVTVISADRIHRFGYRTIGEAVAAVAGLYLEDNRINASLGIRGLQIPGDFNTRILILVDGATINEAWGSSAGLGFENVVSIDEIARIEVIRGPVSSVYGANAFFGIINIVTRGAAESARVWGRVGVHQIAGVIGTAGFAIGGVDRQVRGTVLATSRFGETLSVPGIGDELSGDGGHAVSGSLVGAYGGSFLQIRGHHTRVDSPFAPYNGDPTVATPYEQYNTQLLVEGGHARDLGTRVAVAARGYLNVYRFSDDIQQLPPLPKFLDFGDATTVGGELRSRFALLDRDRLGITVGAEASYNKTKSRSFELGNEANGAGGLRGVPLNFNQLGAYAEVDAAPTSWLGATAGVRVDRNSEVDTRLSPRLALFLANPEKYGIKLLYAEGFRNPSPFEGAFFDNMTFSANPDIGAERIRSAEAVLWAKPVPGLSVRLSGFHWDARDVIQQLLDPDDPTMTLLQFQNVGRFVSQGVEAELGYRNSAGWFAFGGACIARIGTALSGGEVEYGDVPDAAAVTANGGLSTPPLFGIAHVSAQATYLGKRPTRAAADGTASPKSPAWFGLDLTIYAPRIRGFDLTAGVRNLIGKRDLVPAPGDYDRFNPDLLVIPRIPGEGRELYVKLGYSY